jgi:hypothetical protein
MHPFEFDRAVQVEALLRQELGDRLDLVLRAPKAPATIAQLSAVHDPQYLKRSHHSGVIARIIEVYALVWCPRFLM